MTRKLVSDRVCARCGGSIPPERRSDSLYCSRSCKKLVNDERWRKRSSGYMRQYLYGVTPLQFAEMLTRQGGRCAICRTETPGGKGGWHVDHDHVTGRVRGLLCHRCNLMIGHAGDDPHRLQAAVAYLSQVEGEE